MSNSTVFALDIGTRKIAGLLMSPSEQGFTIEHAALLQQLPGAMRDGQIHHIPAVARVIREIKHELEQRTNTTLKEVAVAAAGRSLMTQKGASTYICHPRERLSPDQVKALELDAVMQAMGKLDQTDQEGAMDTYICVGYSVLQYYLDKEPIGSLVGHQGQEASVEVIATFLPRVVIDSLGTALEEAELKMVSLTLEPIAAMHVVVPPTMRMLNIALVDVGAGTSDIAISAEGTIKAYGMVSSAGDEITEGIAEHFLLDLSVAEEVKRELVPNRVIECRDVFGNPLTLSYEEVLEVISPLAQELAHQIAHEVLRLNEGAPKGVILVGGGSLTPQLASFIASALQLPENVVRGRTRDSISSVVGAAEFSGPEVITPIGIGCTHLDGLAMELIHVTVNGSPLQFLKLASSTINDALINAGFTINDLVGRPGAGITVELNGRCIAIPGTIGQPAQILCSGVPTELSAPLENGAILSVTEPVPGEPPKVTLGEFMEPETSSYHLTLNGRPLAVEPRVLVNGHTKGWDYVIQDRDIITTEPITTVIQLLNSLEIPVERQLHFTLNKQPRTISHTIKVKINGIESSLHTPLQDGIKIDYYHKPITLRDVVDPSTGGYSITITVNGEPITLSPKRNSPWVNGEMVSFDYIIRPNDVIQYNHEGHGEQNFIVTDLFRDYLPDDAFLEKGGRILVNGKESGYTTPLKHGDKIEFVP